MKQSNKARYIVFLMCLLVIMLNLINATRHIPHGGWFVAAGLLVLLPPTVLLILALRSER